MSASRRRAPGDALLVVLLLAGCGAPDSIVPEDQDGIIGGDVELAVTVDDTGFAPAILKTQNLANVTIALENRGAAPHGMFIGCVATTCFPAAASIAPIEPGARATTMFVTPRVEGIYPVSSEREGRAVTGQFVIQ